MALVTWSDFYRTAIPIVDEQHQRLFLLINELHESLHSSRGKGQVPRILDALVEHAGMHFRTEEDFMGLHHFDGLAAHRAEHGRLMQSMRAFRERWPQAEARPMDLSRFVGDWLTRHIVEMDFQYAMFLKDRGIFPRSR